jgi:hypothetical protein
MKTICFSLFWIISAACAHGTVVSPGMPAYLGQFVRVLEESKAQGRALDIEHWSDIEALPFELQVRMLGTHVQDEPNVSDYFVIVPRSERAKFPKGNLLIISADPFNLTAWHRDWYKTNQKYTPEQLADFDKFNPKDSLVRWYLTEDKEGKFARASIAEEDLQKIIEQTGLTLPTKPEPYRFNMSQVDPATGRPINAPASPSPSLAASGAEAVPTPTPKPAPAPVAPPAKSTNPLWWIVGAIAALVAVVLVVRRKKPKA